MKLQEKHHKALEEYVDKLKKERFKNVQYILQISNKMFNTEYKWNTKE